MQNLQTSARSVLALLVLLLLPSGSQGDVVWLKNQSQPLYGIVDLAQSNDTQLAFSKTSNGTDFELVLVDRNNIKATVINVDKSKLEALVPDKPESWFDHAEWLSTQKQDPVARKLAIRLLLITARHSPQKSIRDSAIQNLIPLARTDEESRKFKQLSWLETGTPVHGNNSGADAVTLQLDPAQRNVALDIVQAVRRGSRVEPARWSEFKEIVGVPVGESVAAMSKADTLSRQQLNQLVTLEFRLRNPDLPKTQTKSNWLDFRSAIQQVQLDFPTIDNVTEIDPSKTLYLNGTWVKR